MLSMEGFVGARALGEESLQMWDLNKRLEAYLARVKFLEEENEVLRAEIQSAKGSPGEDSWRTKYEEELRALRAMLDDAFREKCSVELARDNLYEEIQHVKSRCQKEQAAREEAKKQLSLSKKELEEERRAQIWLKERALQLEKEVEALLEVHEEEKAGLDHEIASFSQSLESFRCVPVAFQPVEVEDYSKRLSEIWKGAVETYKTEVSQLESSLCQAKESLWKAVEDNQQSQLQLQHLEKDLAGLKARKDMLEESLSRQWQEQRGEAEKFQLALEALEQEKQALRVQIAQVLEDRQQLMHLKMSLSLEVATYRTLLEAESTRLQMPAGEYKLANGLRDVKLETSTSKLQPATPESRRLLSWDHRMSPSVFPKVEAKMQLAKTQSDSLKALTPKSKSPVTREFQKINSVLQSPALKAAGPSRDHGAAGRSVPSPAPPSGALPAAGMEAATHPCSQEQPEPLSPMVPAGPEPSEKNKHPHEEAVDEETQDPSEEPPGKSPTPQLLYPDRLVTEALEDALKEVRDDAEPKEEPMLEAERATEGYRVGSAPELPGWTAADHPTEEVDGAEDANFEALLEERAGEDMHKEPDMESTAQRDGATSHLELGPSGEQEEESTPDFLVAAQSEIETQEEMRSWEEEGSREEEMPMLLSPEESGEPEFVRDTADSPLGEDTLASSGPNAECWEGSTGHPSQAAAVGGGLEEPEQGEDDVEAVSTEALNLSEDEERREPWSPSREDEECDFPEEAKEVREGESLQREIQATHACPMESHPVLPGESHLEEDLVEREQESLGHQEMPLCETDPAADEEGREETCPEHEPSSIKESISAEEASSRAEEDTMGEEITDRARDGEGEMGEPGEEDLEEEDLRAEGKPLGPEDLRQEEVTLEESGGLQENGFEDDLLEQEDLETLPREEVLGGRDDDNYQKHCPEDREMKGEEDMEGSPGREDASVTSQEPAWADDILTSTGVPESEETEGISPAEIEEMGKDDEDDTGSRMSRQEPTPQNETEQEAEPALGLAREAQEGHQDPPGDEEPATAPEVSWEAQTRAEDAGGELSSEPDEPEKASTGSAAFQQAPGDYAESDESQEEDTRRTEELGQEPGTGKSIQLEDTLPDDTPLHLYEGEMLAAIASSPNPLASEDATEPDPGPEIAVEDEGELEGSRTPTTPLKEGHEEEEAGMEPAPAAERAEEEEGYFMVSAPNQEVPSSEEAEISEDFEEITVEATEASKDDLKAPRETSPVPEEEGCFEAFVGEADKGIKMPTEEREMPRAGDFTAEEEDAVPAVEPGSPPGEGRFTGIADEPDRGAESPDADSGTHEGQEPSEGFAAEPDEVVGGTAEPESDASRGAEFPSHDSPWQPGMEEPFPGQEDESGAAELIPPGGLQAQTDPGEAAPAESALVEQPSLAPEDKMPDGDSLFPAEEEQISDADPPPPGSSQEADDRGGSDPGHDGSTGTNQDTADGLDLPAKMPADVMKDSDILEIVEQALEFNQGLMLGARLAEAEQQAPGGTEPTRPPRDLGEDDGDSSPVSSSEEEPTVQETPAAAAPSAEEPATAGIIRAENRELNGLHSEASLEDLAEFPEELPNGIAEAQPARHQEGHAEQEQFGKVPLAQELPGEEAEPAATSAAVPPPPEGPGYGEAPAGKNPTQSMPLLGKHESASVVSALGDEVLHLAPGQPPRRRLQDEQESWSSEDD
ncbi:nestin [Apteryx mantelli]|uniref:Nestin n=1 Tax=Apteryx mantelli TaxID=2696672 RepID=A0ABM4FWZ7_9AVES